MGKPRTIILVRHAQSEGNKNRDIHQYVPDHRVRLTQDGHAQAMEAGRRLRSMLRPDDTVRFYTSPYRRTRETTENMISTLTENHPELGSSPFCKDQIKVYEEPRLREQDFGNFQPCSAEMERMWQERADYGHFFYRIPNGESAADAYDRVSGFNESLWRSFNDDDFPSVCVLVTHGLMTRVFLMKWYHWTVEHFEDLRNINHCEFIVMDQHPETHKYVLQNELRTWSDLKRRAATANGGEIVLESPSYIPKRQWGGCANGCEHAKQNIGQRIKRVSTKDILHDSDPKAPNEQEDHPHASQEEEAKHRRLSERIKKLTFTNSKSMSTGTKKVTRANGGFDRSEDVDPLEHVEVPVDQTSHTYDQDDNAVAAGDEASESSPSAEEFSDELNALPIIKDRKGVLRLIPERYGRDAGGSLSGLGSPQDGSDDSDFFDTNAHQLERRMSSGVVRSGSIKSILSRAKIHGSSEQVQRRVSYAEEGEDDPSQTRSARHGSTLNSRSDEQWAKVGGMASGQHADSLGDTVHHAEEKAAKVDRTTDEVVEHMKEMDRKSMSEVY